MLYFGMWRHYWEATGNPLCFGVESGWNKSIVDTFVQSENVVKFADETPCYVKNIEALDFQQTGRVDIIYDLLNQNISKLKTSLEETPQ